MSQWNEGVCSCFPKDTMQATPVCKAGGSSPSTSAPTTPTPTPPTPPSPTPASCDSMGITNSDQCYTGCLSRNADISTWIQENGDSFCKCGWEGKDQYVLCENTTSGASALSGLMAALLASGAAMMMIV